MSPQQREKCEVAKNDFLRNPASRGLNLEKLAASQDRYSVRADSGLRIILSRPGGGETWIFERAGEHDAMYRYASRAVSVFGAAAGSYRTFSRDELLSGPEEQHSVPNREGVFSHWSEEQLLEAEFTVEQIGLLREMTDEIGVLLLSSDYATDSADAWSDADAAKAFEVLGQLPQEYLGADRGFVLDPVREFVEQHGIPEGLTEEFTAQQAREVGWTSEPIEDWMIFLHPSQREPVETVFSGPLLVTGAAGTGKSVVALHRAVTLAERYKKDRAELPILFTTSIRGLSAVQQQLFSSIPAALTTRVEFSNIHQVAHAITNLWVDLEAADAAFRTAYKRSSLAGNKRFTRDYIHDEIRYLIKGRGIERFAEYSTLQRRGRRVALTKTLRRQVWDLYVAYQEELDAGGLHDFDDQILAALAVVQSEPARYGACLIDEAQDFSLNSLRLARALVTGPDGAVPADGLTVVGDGAQRVYPGSYSLRDAGIEVRGRSRSLQRNYRNSAEILEAAFSVAGSDLVVALALDHQEFSRDREKGNAPITGKAVELVRCSDQREQDHVLPIEILKEVQADVGTGDIAVLTTNNIRANHWARVLKDARIGIQPVSDYEGTTNMHVKVGTFRSAKGLEFKVVFIPDLTEGQFPPGCPPGWTRDQYREDLEVRKTRLFVAMTRARQSLVLSCVGEPSEFLWDCLENFHERPGIFQETER